MNYSNAGWKFDEVRDQILVATKDNQMGFYETSLGELLKSYDGEGLSSKKTDYVLTPTGFDHLCARIDYPKSALAKLSSRLRVEVAREVAADKWDTPVKVATSGIQVDAIFSQEYEPISNAQLAILLGTTLPEDAMVHRWDLAPDNRRLDLRIVAPESWPANLGNGRPDPGYGGIHVINDEIGRAALSVNLVVARVACFNYVVSQHQVLRQEHRWFSPAEFHKALTANIGNVPSYVDEVAAEMREWRHTPVAEPEIAFSRVAEIAGVPQYAMSDAREYWQAEGGEHNLFAVTQAVSHGLKGITDSNRGRNPWDRRNQLERMLLSIGTEAAAYSEEHGHDFWHECQVCHQPLPEVMSA